MKRKLIQIRARIKTKYKTNFEQIKRINSYTTFNASLNVIYYLNNNTF